MRSLSAVIITLNEEKNIGRCIDSLRHVADEIIVLDSYSSDHTVSIAAEKGALVRQEEFAGYKEQKNRAVRLAKYDYVLSLDADEVLSPELISAIISVKRNFHFRAYSMNRYNHYCGRFINHGLWYPDKKVRLFDKRIARWGGLNPHDKIELPENEPVKFLCGDILHYTFNTTGEHVARNERMSEIAARSLFEAGIKRHWWKIILSPAWSFLNGYIFRLGFTDGYHGFLVAKETARLSFLKYQKLFRMKRLHQKSLVGSILNESL